MTKANDKIRTIAIVAGLSVGAIFASSFAVEPAYAKTNTLVQVAVSSTIVHVSSQQLITVTIIGGTKLAGATCSVTATNGTSKSVSLNSSGKASYVFSTLTYRSIWASGANAGRINASCSNKKYVGSASVTMALTR